MSIKVTRMPKSIIVWHSVNDELPDAGIDVFLGLATGELFVGHYDDEDKTWRSLDAEGSLDVTWWAEMPEVPK